MNGLVYQIMSAVLAGGLAGQLTTVFLNRFYQARRDEENWLRQERYRLFCEVLDTTSLTATREEDGDFRTWPDEIRAVSQKIHLLSPRGEAPPVVAATLEELFQLVLARKLAIKHGRTESTEDAKVFRHVMREKVRLLRKSLSASLLKHGTK